jgi:hypothetical protein
MSAGFIGMKAMGFKNLLKNSGFVSGHDFSRAINAAK